MASYGKLLVATEGRTVREITLRIGRLIVGRTPDNDVYIDSRFVSRHHCQVITTPHSCVIEDLNSTNGIFVKSARVRRHYLNDGDVVLIGKHELIYVDERAPRSRNSHIDTIPGLHAATAEDVARLDLFGRKAGLAFQIVDDVLDMTVDSAHLGKTAGKDQATEKATWPAVFGIEQSQRDAESLIKEAFAALAPYGSRADGFKSVAAYLVERKN